MYLKTPKRYTRRGQRRSVFSLRRLLLFILSGVVIFVGIGIYENREMFIPIVSDFVNGVYENINSGVATAQAPEPTPTTDPSSFLVVANDAWTQGRIEDALSTYQNILDTVPNDAAVHYRVTLGLIMEGRFDEAVKAAEDTVTANPFSSDAWAIRASAYENNGDFKEAIASALQALELNPNSARAMAYLAEAYLDAGKPERALDEVQKALDADPNSFEAHRIYGRIAQEHLFDLTLAEQEFKTASDLAPNIIYPQIDLAWMEVTNGQVDQAIDRVLGVLDLNPNNPGALLTVGTFYYQTVGNYNRAEDYLQRCVNAAPDNILCHYLLGRAQYNLDQFTSAWDSFKAAIDLGSHDPKHFYWAGEAQITLGNCPLALQYLRPGYDMAQQAGDENLVSDFEYQLGRCQSPVSLPTDTPSS